MDVVAIQDLYNSYREGARDERTRILLILDKETYSEHGITLIGEEVRRQIYNRIFGDYNGTSI